MKGIILAGGLGTRLGDLTKTNNKHLLPIYDKPMIYYPIQTLVNAGIDEIMIVVSGPYSGNFINLLKNGEDFNLKSLVYGYQYKPDGGIADALSIAKNFCDNDSMCVILGDNTTDANIKEDLVNFQSIDPSTNSPMNVPSAHLFIKEVPDPKRFGVATIENGKIIGIEEKPKYPKSNLAVTGLYCYDNNVFDFIDQCSPSERGEMEITDVNNFYLNNGKVTYSMLDGFWKDAGTFETLFQANEYWKNKAQVLKEAVIKDIIE